MSLLLLNVTLRGVSNKHCLLSLFSFFLYGNIQFEQHVLLRIFFSVTSDCKVRCPRVGLEVKIYDTPARGIRASQGTFTS